MPASSSRFLAGVAVATLLAGAAVYAFLPAAQQNLHAAASHARAAVLATLSPAAGEQIGEQGGEQAATQALVPHRAIYDFRMLGISAGNAALSDIRGRMFYEQADACDGWTTDHRFTSQYFYAERAPVLNVSQYSAWEAKDGSLFQFNSERQENGDEGEQLRGAVEAGADGRVRAEFSRPPELSYDLPDGFYLPVAHTAEMLRRARAGEKIFHAVMFDGTDADGPVEVNAVIIRALTAEEQARLGKDAAGKPLAQMDAALLAAPAWRIRMAVFPLYPKEGSVDTGTPSYEMEMVLHDNGVISDAVVDYQQFKVAQRLTAIEALPPVACP